MALTDEQIKLFEANEDRKVIIDTLELSHSAMSSVYRICRNNADMNVTIEDGTRQLFIATNFMVSLPALDDKASTSIQVSVDLVNNAVVSDIEAVMLDTSREPLKMIYRAYTDQSTQYPILGPIALEVTDFSVKNKRLTFDAKDKDMINNTFPRGRYSANNFRGIIYA